MFQLTESAKGELQSRLKEKGPGTFIRMKMRDSCFAKVRVSLDDTVQPNDMEIEVEGLQFRIDPEQIHYFQKKELDFRPDNTGFKEFDIR